MKNNLRKIQFESNPHITWAELSRITGTSVMQIYRIRDGADPSVSKAITIARALNKSVEDIWGL